jgi:hypothetical protein
LPETPYPLHSIKPMALKLPMPVYPLGRTNDLPNLY